MERAELGGPTVFFFNSRWGRGGTRVWRDPQATDLLYMHLRAQPWLIYEVRLPTMQWKPPRSEMGLARHTFHAVLTFAAPRAFPGSGISVCSQFMSSLWLEVGEASTHHGQETCRWGHREQRRRLVIVPALDHHESTSRSRARGRGTEESLGLLGSILYWVASCLRHPQAWANCREGLVGRPGRLSVPGYFLGDLLSMKHCSLVRSTKGGRIGLRGGGEGHLVLGNHAEKTPAMVTALTSV